MNNELMREIVWEMSVWSVLGLVFLCRRVGALCTSRPLSGECSLGRSFGSAADCLLLDASDLPVAMPLAHLLSAPLEHFVLFVRLSLARLPRLLHLVSRREVHFPHMQPLLNTCISNSWLCLCSIIKWAMLSVRLYYVANPGGRGVKNEEIWQAPSPSGNF